MNYSEALSYITEKCTFGSVYGLERIKEVLQRLSFPERGMRIIHIAGTNGKGSVSRMIMNILFRSGYTVGIFNSPYLERKNEYLCVNGEEASDGEFALIAGIVKNAVEGKRLGLDPMEQNPTEFEFSFAMAMEYFCRKKCDFAIVECGLGGLSDATNIFDEKELSIITNIGLDHTGILGDNLSEIAAQKCGIILKGDTVIAYPSEKSAMDVIKMTCQKKNARLIVPDFSYVDEKGFSVFLDKLSLKGEFQKKNAASALAAAFILKEKGYRKINSKSITVGLSTVSWPGRFEYLKDDPTVIADGGHNVQCAEALCRSLERENIGSAIFVIGIMADKNYEEVFRVLCPFVKAVVATEPSNPRRLPAEDICSCFKRLTGNEIKSYIDRKPSDAIAKALKIDSEQYGNSLPVIITGSLYMMADIRRSLLTER